MNREQIRKNMQLVNALLIKLEDSEVPNKPAVRERLERKYTELELAVKLFFKGGAM